MVGVGYQPLHLGQIVGRVLCRADAPLSLLDTKLDDVVTVDPEAARREGWVDASAHSPIPPNEGDAAADAARMVLRRYFPTGDDDALLREVMLHVSFPTGRLPAAFHVRRPQGKSGFVDVASETSRKLAAAEQRSLEKYLQKLFGVAGRKARTDSSAATAGRRWRFTDALPTGEGVVIELSPPLHPHGYWLRVAAE